MRILTEAEFDCLNDLAFKLLGIQLPMKRREAISYKLSFFLEKSGFDNFSQYHKYLVEQGSENAISELVERLVTNFSFFNREEEHFGFLIKEILPDLIFSQGARSLDIWCAGCSSGEEPYTAAMYIADFFDFNIINDFSINIKATDISKKAISKARRGVYESKELENLPANLKGKFFNKLNKDEFEINNRIKDMVSFQILNLKDPGFPFDKTFDLIMCRNVLYYFKETFIKDLLDRFFKSVKNGGYFVTGYMDKLDPDIMPFKSVEASIYRKMELIGAGFVIS